MSSFKKPRPSRPPTSRSELKQAGVLHAALAVHKQGQLDEAKVLYQQVLESDPHDFNALQLLAALEIQRLDPVRAVALLDQALQIYPAHAGSHNNRGNALFALMRFTEALASYERALQLEPGDAQFHFNRANTLAKLRQLAPALAAYAQALEIEPDYVEAHQKLASALCDLQQMDLALASFARALQIRPDYAEAHFSESLCRLLMGDFALGWQKYEWRFEKAKNTHPRKTFDQPLWLGQESLQHKTILLHSEQGFGDTIQFCRYAKQVAALGATVILEVPAALTTLLSGLEGVAVLVTQGDAIPEFDYHCPLMSLPLAFHTDLTTMSQVPYLHCDAPKSAQWQAKFSSSKQEKIGVVWRGSSAHDMDAERSVPFDKFNILFQQPADFYCLQAQLPAAEQALLAQTALPFFASDLHDFSDTAALIEAMDLVITVDTSVAHLAGALGKEVWILLPYAPDWRWLLGRTDSPWYGSARLFRQPRFGDWDSVLAQLALALQQRAQAASQQAAPALELALALHQQAQFDQAEILYKEILESQPRHFDALRLLATSTLQRQDFSAARVLFERAIGIDPELAELHQHMGHTLCGLQQWALALESYQRVLQLAPEHVEAHYNCGIILYRMKRLPEALASYAQVIRLQPEHVHAYNNQGVVLFDLQRPEQALLSYELALQFEPNYVDAHNNCGNALRQLRRPAAALQSYEHALRGQPEHAEAHNNRALTLLELGRWPQALLGYRRALELKPEQADFHFNLAACLLLLGDFALGWPHYEWRWQQEPNRAEAQRFSTAPWLGQEALRHRTILLHSEQGYGDTIQFCRYAQQVAALGATVILEVPLVLKALLTQVEGVSQIVGKGEALPDVDYHSPLMSLPLAFHTDLASMSKAPYLHAEPQQSAQWQAKLGPRQRSRVGLAWRGSATHVNDAARSMALEMLSSILLAPVDLYCLQPELDAADRAVLEQSSMTFFGADLQDYSATAALIAQMDLVITVDTSVAHLAGAMGKEVWILLGFTPDWRWLLERSDSPWYGSARLFRQPQMDDWGSVVKQVAIALEQWRPKPALPVLLPGPSAAEQLKQGFALHEAGDIDRAAALYRAILAAQPAHFDALQLLALIAINQCDFTHAIALLDQAIKIDPLQAHAHHNRGIALNNMLRLDDALASYAVALQLQPDYLEARINDGMCRLLSADFVGGWPQFEWRWRHETYRLERQRFTAAPWLGQEDLRHRTILLHFEQGYGDTIQFCRYAKQVAALGATVILEVPLVLKSLLRQIEGVAQVVGLGEALPEFDYHCPLMSLALVFHSDLASISKTPYLQSEPQESARWQAKLGPHQRLRVGLAWHGSVEHTNNAARSIGLEALRSVLQAPADFYCLQPQLHAADLALLEQLPITFFGAALSDFSATAALIAQMDLVLTIDTSVAHLAGAMGKKVWILLPYVPDWRWLLERTDSPWYGSARLFRQPAAGDWDSVLAQVATALAQSTMPLTAAQLQANAATLDAAFALHQQGQFEQAEVLYKAVAASQPEHPEAWQLLATIALQRADFAVALRLFDHALQIDPEHAESYHNRGNALRSLQQLRPALDSYERALQLKPDFAESHNCRGNVLFDLKRATEALASFECALRFDPRSAQIHNNRGFTLLALRRLPEALVSFERALQLKPEYADAHTNRGNALHHLQRSAAALVSYEQALQLQPEHAGFHLNAGICRLLTGDFERGWQQYEWRWKKAAKSTSHRYRTQAHWLGQEDLRHKTILLYCEQGYGDTLQFCRYAAQVAQLGATVILEVQAPLKSILRQLPGVTLIVAQGEELPQIDYYCPLMSLPLALQVNLSSINPAPYLHADPEPFARWQAVLGPQQQARVGLVWSGNAGHERDDERSIPLAAWSTVLSAPADFYCLQQVLRRSDREVLDQTGSVTFFGRDLQDFSDTAALIALMDLVITVDTSVAHLAGAMGKEVWILVPLVPDWRWLLERDDSPWYGSARLFRQTSHADWDSVLSRVAQALQQRVSAPPPVATAPADGSKLQTAFALHQQGQLDQAAALYREILQSQAEHFDALQLLAAIATQRHEYAAAVKLFEQVIQINPEHADVHHNLGNALRGLQQWELALASYERALQLRPGFAEAWNCRGNVLLDLKRWPEALTSYEQALQLNPAHALAHSNRGLALFMLQRFAQALHSYEQALHITPDAAQVHNQRGVVLSAMKQLAPALASYERALALQADYPEALYNRSTVLLALQRWPEALASCERALQLDPEYAAAYYSRGRALHLLNRSLEALDSYEQALRFRPDHADTHNNRGIILYELGRSAAALDSYAQALRYEPEHSAAHYNESLCRLRDGDFAQGWPKYEWRWKKVNPLVAPRTFSQALWLGQDDLRCKTILLHSEQGLGDTIQFCRYVKQVAMLGATVILQVPPVLTTLFSQLDGSALILPEGAPLPAFDYHCPLMSLPLAFQTDLDTLSNAPYLQSTPQKTAQWQAKLVQNQRKKVGLAWCGSPVHDQDAQRSVALDALQMLLSAPVDFYALQPELRSTDRALLEQSAITFFGAALRDFSDSAALIGLMDVVITVDTSVAHLAGAMGKEVWILLPFSPDWRWLLERADSPWYGSARLFRQPRPGDWASVMAQVALALQAFVAPPAKRNTSAAEDLFHAAFSLQQQGQIEQAASLYEALLQAQPEHGNALQMLAIIVAQQRDLNRAATLFERAIALNPSHAELHHNLGHVLLAGKQLLPALGSYERALQLKPDLVEAHGKCGMILLLLKRLPAALASWEEVLRLEPDHAEAHNYRGTVLLELKRQPEALASYEQALRYKPDYAEAHQNRGIVLHDLQCYEAALASYEQALHFQPEHAETYNNLGLTLLELGRAPQALLRYGQALQLNPEQPDFNFNQGLCRLLMADFALGWQQYEWRWKKEGNPSAQKVYRQPEWRGQQDLHGQTILLHAEQGFGDSIQFCRYAKRIAELGATVILDVPIELKTLLRHTEGVALVVSKGDALPEFDYHCSLMSLPLAFQTDLASISNQPYLRSEEQKSVQWQAKLGPQQQKRVGLVWSGSIGHQNDAARSIPLAALAAILRKPAEFYCLQTALRAADHAALEHTSIRFFGDDLHDFSDTAALISLMDLVITVDTSVAHLAGAMGKPVWILLPFTPDWRWLLARADSPWYGSARLFRQPAFGDWTSVLQQVAIEME